MEAKWKRRLLAMGMVLVAGMGCNPILAPFILGRDDTKTPAEFALKVPEERKKAHQDARVVILVSAVQGRTDLVGIDKAISIEVGRAWKRTQGEQGKGRRHPRPAGREVEVGQHELADDDARRNRPEVQGRLRHQPRDQGNRHLRTAHPAADHEGRTDIEVTAYEMVKATEVPEFRCEINEEYPHGRVIEASDVTASKFKSDFVKKIANEIAWKFTEHEAKDRFATE